MHFGSWKKKEKASILSCTRNFAERANQERHINLVHSWSVILDLLPLLNLIFLREIQHTPISGPEEFPPSRFVKESSSSVRKIWVICPLLHPFNFCGKLSRGIHTFLFLSSFFLPRSAYKSIWPPSLNGEGVSFVTLPKRFPPQKRRKKYRKKVFRLARNRKKFFPGDKSCKNAFLEEQENMWRVTRSSEKNKTFSSWLFTTPQVSRKNLATITLSRRIRETRGREKTEIKLRILFFRLFLGWEKRQ